MPYKVLELIFHAQPYFPPHVTETEVHEDHKFHIYTHIFTREFDETNVQGQY